MTAIVAEFADWDRSTDPGYLACSRALVAAVSNEDGVAILNHSAAFSMTALLRSRFPR